MPSQPSDVNTQITYPVFFHISTLHGTSSVTGFELQVKQFNETESTVNAYEQSSKDCTETQYT